MSALDIEKIGKVQILFVCMGQQRKFGKVISLNTCMRLVSNLLNVIANNNMENLLYCQIN